MSILRFNFDQNFPLRRSLGFDPLDMLFVITPGLVYEERNVTLYNYFTEPMEMTGLNLPTELQPLISVRLSFFIV